MAQISRLYNWTGRVEEGGDDAEEEKGEVNDHLPCNMFELSFHCKIVITITISMREKLGKPLKLTKRVQTIWNYMYIDFNIFYYIQTKD